MSCSTELEKREELTRSKTVSTAIKELAPSPESLLLFCDAISFCSNALPPPPSCCKSSFSNDYTSKHEDVDCVVDYFVDCVADYFDDCVAHYVADHKVVDRVVDRDADNEVADSVVDGRVDGGRAVV